MKKPVITILFLVLFSIEFFSQEDLSQRILGIKENYTRINGIKNWEQSTELLNYKTYCPYLDKKVIHQATVFYNNQKLEKIKVVLSSEMFKTVKHYYFLNNELSLVAYLYKHNVVPNQPKKAKIVADTLYFLNKELIYAKQDSSYIDTIANKHVYEKYKEEVDEILNPNAQEKLSHTILRIKQNYTRINAMKNWTQTKDVLHYIYKYNEGSIPKGDQKVTLFYKDDILEKIKVISISEFSDEKSETLYYFLNKDLSFVTITREFTKYSDGNKPRKEKTTDKYYFANKELIYWIAPGDSGWDMVSGKEGYDQFKEEVVKILSTD